MGSNRKTTKPRVCVTFFSSLVLNIFLFSHHLFFPLLFFVLFFSLKIEQNNLNINTTQKLFLFFLVVVLFCQNSGLIFIFIFSKKKKYSRQETKVFPLGLFLLFNNTT